MTGVRGQVPFQNPNNQNHYTESQARLEIEKLYDKVEAGAAIEDLAEDVSQDPGTYLRGGVIGFVNPEKHYVADFVAVVQALQVNEVSKPFRTEFGYHIVKLLFRKNDKLLLQHLLIRVWE